MALTSAVVCAIACGKPEPALQTTTPSSDPPVAARTDPTPPAVETEPPSEIPCGDTVCVSPDECISFPALTAKGSSVGHACGIRCDPAQRDADCPTGKRCVPIADGPGPVCR